MSEGINMTAGIVLAAPKDVAAIIKPENVSGAFYASNKAQLLRELGNRAGAALGLDAQVIVDRLFGRERLGSTAVGRGCAVPHTSVPGLAGFFGSFIRLERPVDFAAPDSHPVDLAFLLLSPEDAGKAHLTALACICRCLRDPVMADRIRITRDPARIYQLLTGRLPEAMAS
jgi:PTS system nitrogen regulatory IIA component